MIYRLGDEEIEPNHWVAFVFDHPGCFSSGATQEEAIADAPARIKEYFEWLADYDCAMPSPSGPIEVKIEQVLRAIPSAGDPDYIVNAFFDDDGKPLTRPEVETGLARYGYAAHDLQALVEKIPATRLTQPLPSDAKNSIARILDHVAWAEWWYFDRLNLTFQRSDMTGDALATLEKVRAQTCAQLPKLGDTRIVEDKVNEKWSARKVLRRTIWHMRDHTLQITQIINLTKG